MTIHRIRLAEPGIRIILGGDFNEKLEDPKNSLMRKL